MKTSKRFNARVASLLLTITLFLPFLAAYAQNWSPVTTTDNSAPEARHESGAVVVNDKIYLLGGRGIRGVDVYDPAANTWTSVAQAPLELHHFQPVAFAGKIYVIGAFTCCFPLEPTISDIHVFDPSTNTWSIEGSMPANRLRGSAGTVVHQNKIYVIGGNTDGHSGGAVNWFDEYDPATGEWRVLPDAPNARDHFAAAIAGGKLIAAAGRQTQLSFANTVQGTDVYDFTSGQWTSTSHNIPTPRAGTMTAVFGDQVYVIGGESGLQVSAHAEVQVFNPANGLWSQVTPMANPRHAGGSALIVGSELHVFTGSNVRGADGEFDGHEKIDLSLTSLTPLAGTPPLLITQDIDGDGLTDFNENTIHGTDPLKKDTDDDGINDYDEIFSTTTDPTNADSDGDGVEDNNELELTLDPNNPDFDGDGLIDGDELNIHGSLPDNSDSDGDGIIDGDEVLVFSSDPLDIDSDNDNLTDAYEVYTLKSNPNNRDTDNDGVRDDLEHLRFGTGINTADTDGDNLSDGQELNTYNSDPTLDDTDGDGQKDGDEVAAGSSLTNIDEDNDGLVNSAEENVDSDGDGLANFIDRDSDNDGIPDLVEMGFSDLDRDAVLDTLAEIEAANASIFEEQNEPATVEQPAQPSSLLDDDTTDATDATDTDLEDTGLPLVAPTPILVALDSDNDGVPNHIDLDSDQDGISDRVESSANYAINELTIMVVTDSNLDGLDDLYSDESSILPADSDGDGTPNFLDLDSDNDGIFDLVEAGSEDLNNDGMMDSVIDLNNDGIADLGIPILGKALPDADGDNIPDLIDTQILTGGSFGCSVSKSESAFDPTFPMILFLFISQLLHSSRKRRKVQVQVQ